MTTEFVNPFVKKKSEYSRDLNILGHYFKDSVAYLRQVTGRSEEDCTAYVKKTIGVNGSHAFKDPVVECLVRGENGDRVREQTTLNRYLNDAIREKEIIVSTFTTYVNSNVQQSLLSLFIDNNVAARSVAKKEMFKADAAGNKQLYNIKKIEQTNKKLSNNAVSGAHVSPSNPLYNPTGHSTLTSNCRSTAGYGNANNEKLLAGNRHYWSHHIVLNNIISIIEHTDYDKMKSTMEEFALVYPSVDQVMDCILYSSKLYWWEQNYINVIRNLVLTLNPLQRAAFVYTGDFYHIMRLNDSLARSFIGNLSKKITGTHDNPEKAIKGTSEAILNLAHQVCTTETKGIGKDYTSIKGTDAYNTLACTVNNIENTITKYARFINTFFVTKNVPASMAYFPESVRRSALTGDTDSTIFTVQDWVIWFRGKLSFDENAIAVAATMIFLSGATITHILAIMSANFGIEEKRLHQISMKNEFKFDVFIPTQLGKHYFANIGCQEGNVFSEKKMEIKGVYLKSSNAPKIINEKAVSMMKSIMEEIERGEKISILKYLKYVGDIEREIIASILKGESTYLRSGSIKDAASYTKAGNASPYQNYTFFNAVFGPKYGNIAPPPYGTMKISVTTDTVPKFNAWVAKIKDRQFAERLSTYMKNNGKSTITTLHMPVQVLTECGIPDEVVDIIDYRKLVSDICKIYYILLECLGYYGFETKLQRLISDYH